MRKYFTAARARVRGAETDYSEGQDMCERIEAQRAGCWVMLFSIVFLGGCTYVDGGFEYTYHGRLLSSVSHQPIEGQAVLVHCVHSFQSPREYEAEWRENLVSEDEERWMSEHAAITDSDGRFAGRFMSGLSWGITYVLYFIPIQRGSSTPSPLEEVAAYYEDDGEWKQIRIPLTPEAQERVEGSLHIVLGDILVPSEGGP